MNAPRNIVLVGFMGTGKSSSGRVVAQRLGWTFVDMDHEIEQRDGRTIPEIFAASGEAYFRDREAEVVRELAARSSQVISAGGGVVLNPDNTRTLAECGVLVCLHARPETVHERVHRRRHRPLLHHEDPPARIRELLAVRQPLYDAIPDRVDTDGLTPEAVADEILRLARARGLVSPPPTAG